MPLGNARSVAADVEKQNELKVQLFGGISKYFGKASLGSGSVGHASVGKDLLVETTKKVAAAASKRYASLKLS